MSRKRGKAASLMLAFARDLTHQEEEAASCNGNGLIPCQPCYCPEHGNAPAIADSTQLCTTLNSRTGNFLHASSILSCLKCHAEKLKPLENRAASLQILIETPSTRSSIDQCAVRRCSHGVDGEEHEHEVEESASLWC